MLVAGIAHEVNSPAAAVQGLVDALQETVRRLGAVRARSGRSSGLPRRRRCSATSRSIDGLLPEMTTAPLSSSLEARQRTRRLQGGCWRAPTAAARPRRCWRRSAPSASGSRRSCAALAGGKSLAPLAGYLREVAFLARTAGTIRTAIGAIRRIVGALKRYSRLDEAPLERVDVHAGIEDTLVILVASVEVRRKRR